MGVNFDDLFDRRGFEECGGHALFDPKENAIGCCYLVNGINNDRKISALFSRKVYPYCCRSKFNSFKGVFDLEEASFRRKCAMILCLECATHAVERFGTLFHGLRNTSACERFDGRPGPAHTILRPRYEHREKCSAGAS